MNHGSEGQQHNWRHHRSGIWSGVILIVLGAIFLLANLNLLNIDWGKYWPVFLIALGVWTVIQRVR